MLDARVLVILSGTRYHILSQIGASIGSPLKGKVEPLVISRFTRDEVRAYVDAIEGLIDAEQQARVTITRERLKPLLEHFHRFLVAFCGGHPRTMEKTARIFLKSLKALSEHPDASDYEEFVRFLYPRVGEFLANSLFSTDYKEALTGLQVSEQFEEVQAWLLARGSGGLFLGPRPSRPAQSAVDGELKRIVFALMNVGVILQNGQYYYYLTSQFHLAEFLNNIHEDYALLLRQVLHNRFFQQLCGSHAGFCYTFKHIFAACLFTGPYPTAGTDPVQQGPGPTPEVPQDILDSATFTRIQVLATTPAWASLAFEPNLLYHTPTAPIVDFLVMQERTLWLIQVTTSRNPRREKISDLHGLQRQLEAELAPDRPFELVCSWFVSLFPVNEQSARPGLTITADAQLEPFLGAILSRRLQAIKRDLKARP